MKHTKGPWKVRKRYSGMPNPTMPKPEPLAVSVRLAREITADDSMEFAEFIIDDTLRPLIEALERIHDRHDGPSMYQPDRYIQQIARQALERIGSVKFTGIPIRSDPTVPRDEIRLEKDGRIIGRIVNVKPPDEAEGG